MHNFKTSCCFTTFIVACILSSCSEEAATDIPTPKDEIGFTAFYGNDNDITRGAVINEDNLKSFNVSAYAYNSLATDSDFDPEKDPDHDYSVWPATTSSPNFIKNEEVFEGNPEGNPWHTASNHYWPNTDMRMRFFGFANFKESDKDYFSTSYTQITNYKVPETVAEQNDIIAAVSDVLTAEYRTEKKSVPMHFHHIFTGIRFATSPATFTMGDETITNTIADYKIISIGIKNVNGTGTFTLKNFTYTSGKDYDEEEKLDFYGNRGNMWSNVTDYNTTGYHLSFNEVQLKPDYDITNGVEITRNDKGEEVSVTYGKNTMMMIPQILGDDAMMVVTLKNKDTSEEQTFTQRISTLNQQGWGMGQMITYRIFTRETSVKTTIGLTYEVCPWDKKTVTIPDFE